MSILSRLAAVEARQRSYGMHDPDCPTRRTQIAQAGSSMYFTPPECTCWLSAADEAVADD